MSSWDRYTSTPPPLILLEHLALAIESENETNSEPRRPKSKPEDYFGPNLPWRRPGSKPLAAPPSGELIYPFQGQTLVPRPVPDRVCLAARLVENAQKRHQLIIATEGFYAGEWKRGEFAPIVFDGICTWPKTSELACNAAQFALSSYNITEGKELEFKELIRVNAQLSRNTILFLTMKASDELFYEAKVLCEHDSKNMRVLFVRVACHYPVMSAEIQCLTGPNTSTSSGVVVDSAGCSRPKFG